MAKFKIARTENVKIGSLKKNKFHPRTESINRDEIKDSIKTNGIISTPTVHDNRDGTFTVIDGLNVIETAKSLGIDDIICIIYQDLSVAEITHLSYVLNTKRSPLNPIEQANHMRNLMEELGLKHDDMAALGYGSKGNISKTLSVLKAPKRVQNLVAKGLLSKTAVPSLLKLRDHDKMINTAELAVKEHWSVRKIDEFVDEHLNKVEGGENKNKSSEISNPEIKKELSAVETESVDVILSVLNEVISYTPTIFRNEIKHILSESGEKLKPGGIMGLCAQDLGYRKGSSNIDPVLNIINNVLTKNGLDLVDKFVLCAKPGTDDLGQLKLILKRGKHTQHKSFLKFTSLYVFKKRGDKGLPENVQDSDLSFEEYSSFLNPIWTFNVGKFGCHELDGIVKKASRRFIKLYSHKGETVFDPFLSNEAIVKAARELGRKGIGKEPKIESLSVHSKKVLNDLEANQPEKPEAEVMVSEGMKDAVELIIADNSMEVEPA